MDKRQSDKATKRRDVTAGMLTNALCIGIGSVPPWSTFGFSSSWWRAKLSVCWEQGTGSVSHGQLISPQPVSHLPLARFHLYESLADDLDYYLCRLAEVSGMSPSQGLEQVELRVESSNG